MTRFVCDNCGAINEDPKHEFEEYPDAKLPINRFYWEWICEVCDVYQTGEFIDKKTKKEIENSI